MKKTMDKSNQMLYNYIADWISSFSSVGRAPDS